MKDMGLKLSMLWLLAGLAGQVAAQDPPSWLHDSGAVPEVSKPYTGDVYTQESFDSAAEMTDPRSARMRDSSGFGHAMYSSENDGPRRKIVDRAGLLGNTYIDGQYIVLDLASDAPTDFLDGFRTTANVAIPWDTEQTGSLSQDVFLSARHLGLSVSDGGASFETEVDDWSIGTTLFTDVTPWFRPFVQLGYTLSQLEYSFRLPPLGSFSDKDHQSRFLLNFGTEFDLSMDIALRMMLEQNVEDFDVSFYTAELIYWATPHVFFRGGLMGDVDGETIGGLVGGGIAL